MCKVDGEITFDYYDDWIKALRFMLEFNKLNYFLFNGPSFVSFDYLRMSARGNIQDLVDMVNELGIANYEIIQEVYYYGKLH